MKILIISHIADNDGATPVVLAKLAFGLVDYVLLEGNEVDETIDLFLNDGTFENYDRVFITDLGMSYDRCEKVQNSLYASKISLFDHHVGAFHMNDFEFAKVVVSDAEGNAQSGTSLFYDFILNNFANDILRSAAVKQCVELVRQYDTWEWFSKYNNLEAKKFSDLYYIMGNKKYIEYLLDFFSNNTHFFFSEKENYLLEMENNKIQNYIERKNQQFFVVQLAGRPAGVVFAENYRSELGNALAEKHPEVDFVAMISLERAISFRGLNKLDLNDIVKLYGGSGHKNAAAFPLSQHIKREVLKLIFGEHLVLGDGIQTKKRKIKITSI